MSDTARRQLARTVMGTLMTLEAAKMANATDNVNWLLKGVIWQYCQDCQKLCYPARPLCSHCLSEHLDWQHDSGKGTLLSFSNLHISFNELFRNRGVWPIGLIAHEKGPNYYAFLDESITEKNQEVALFTAPDAIEQAVILAVMPGENATKQASELAKMLAHLISS